MTIYAERPDARVRQILVDVGFVVWCVAAVWAALRLHELVARLAQPGREVETTGTRFAESFDRVAAQVPDLPLVGGALRAPFTGLADAGRGLESAGQTHQEVVATLALVLGIAAGVLLIGWAVLRYVPWRIGWIREATAAVALRDAGADLRIFAHRAVARRDLVEIRRAVADPGAALAAGDYDALADLELRTLGLRAATRTATPPSP
jgi:hypothetical protein